MEHSQFENDKMFSNRLFWDKRYVENPELGSGVGSRGENILYKRAIVNKFLGATMPESILDVGCGDHEIFRTIEFGASYVGIDISEAIVNSNKYRFADKRFYCVDFANNLEMSGFSYDAVLCLEVLIHQHIPAEYHRLVRNIIKATNKSGLISGYRSDPRLTVRSPIIAYHEPITESLEAAGAIDIEVVAQSLESDSLVFVEFRVPQAAGK